MSEYQVITQQADIVCWVPLCDTKGGLYWPNYHANCDPDTMDVIRASFKSAVSRGNSYNSYNFYSCEEGDQEGGGPGVRAGLVNEGYQIQVSLT